MTTPTAVPKDIVDTVENVAVTSLKLTDRCDGCSAQAFVQVSVLSGEGQVVALHFCAHHFKRHESALRAIAVDDIHDETDKINKQASQSSP